MPNPDIIPFAFDSALVRVVLDDAGESWFCAKDVALALGYQWNGLKNIQHVPDEWKMVESVSTISGPKDTWFLSEQGLYFFLGRSDKPRALPFQKWLAGEVLPGIRKTGNYSLPGVAAAGAGLPAAQGCAIPDVPEMYHLRPGLRQRLWQDALQTARLDNAGSDVAAQWFVQLCRMMVTGHAPRGGVDETTRRILQFVKEKCSQTDCKTRIGASALYDAFTVWWCARFAEPVPTQQLFGRVMGGHYVQRKYGGKSYYWGLRLAA
ncbi:BRO-N domain-containing protein [Desulfovibrio falkowii]|uniref:BRO-N domain-containing protein n=1 Tax=Desulfovibrio sp. WGS1351 TaxID=3366814 RepID=UPI00372D703F